MPLNPEVLNARIAWRIAMLRELAAETFVQHSRHGSSGPCLTRRTVASPRRPRPQPSAARAALGRRRASPRRRLRFFVASARVRDLLLRAKHLFVTAIVARR